MENISADIIIPSINSEISTPAINGDLGGNNPTVIYHDIVPVYDGPYELTPTESMQFLLTAERKLTENFVVNPIPTNYGRITWDGSNITIT